MEPELRARLAEAAKMNNRSLHQEVIARLEESLDGYNTLAEVAKLNREKAEQMQAYFATMSQFVETLKRFPKRA